jgi:hypothetical protein
MQELYKQGKLAERDYYYGMTDAVFKYSALEFLGLKAMFEIKKALNRMNNASTTPQSTTELASAKPQSGPQNSIASFISAKSLPGRDEITNVASRNEQKCTSCGKTVSNVAKFCTTCGNKM